MFPSPLYEMVREFSDIIREIFHKKVKIKRLHNAFCMSKMLAARICRRYNQNVISSSFARTCLYTYAMHSRQQQLSLLDLETRGPTVYTLECTLYTSILQCGFHFIIHLYNCRHHLQSHATSQFKLIF